MSVDPSRVGSLFGVALLAIGASALTPKTNGLASDLAAAVCSEVTTNAVVPGPTLIAPPSGGPVTGTAIITSLDATRLKGPVKTALITCGAADIAKTDTFAADVATAFVDEITNFGVVLPGTLVSTNTPVSPGVATGAGVISGLNPVRLAAPLKSALLTVGAADIPLTDAFALALAAAVTGELLVFAQVVPVVPLVAPPGGGPLVGILGVT